MGTPWGHRLLAVGWVVWPSVGVVGCRLSELASVGPPTEIQPAPNDTQPMRNKMPHAFKQFRKACNQDFAPSALDYSNH